MKLIEFEKRSDASRYAAELLSRSLTDHLTQRSSATLVLSGGTTPQQCLATLATCELPWENVKVTLTDERMVTVDHPESNERMLREHLLVGHAAKASFVKLDATCDEDFAGVLIGMGADGHFASIFPDMDNLDQALSAQAPDTLTVNTTASPHPRQTMSLARLLRSQVLVLLAFGDEKRKILDAPDAFPVSHLLAQQTRPANVVWAR
ncbi:MAG: 6-phosphogluconolactonase [Pseudomonadota bacterium]